MSNQANKPFLKLVRSKETEELLSNPDAFILLTQIALRAKRTLDLSIYNLKIGEALIGDYKKIGLTEQRYRTAKANVQKWSLATFRSTNKGTIARLTDSRVYDINEEEINEQTNEQPNEQPNRPATTNKNEKNIRIKEYNIISLEKSSDDLQDKNLVIEEKETKKKSSAKRKNKEFIPPSLEEVLAYCEQRKNSIDAKYFFDFYSIADWQDTLGNKIKNWKQKIITWESKNKNTQVSDNLTLQINKICGSELISATKESSDEIKIICKSPIARSKIYELSEENKNKIKALFNNKKFQFIC